MTYSVLRLPNELESTIDVLIEIFLKRYLTGDTITALTKGSSRQTGERHGLLASAMERGQREAL